MSARLVTVALACAIIIATFAHMPRADARGHANHFRRWEAEQDRALDLRQSELLAAAAARPTNTLASLQLSLAAQPLSAVDTSTFTQFVDHFEVTTLKDSERRTFAQRYYSNFDYYKPGGPAFLYVGGEAELRSTCISRGEIVTLAQQHGGALFGLEHRYYGVSHPFDTLASENMVYLTVEQALEDAAAFIDAMTHAHDLGDGLWFTVGGSYPGVLSSFMRVKYPHLVAGALASSGPVHADAEFWQYEKVIIDGIGPTCAQAVRNATHAVEARMSLGPEATAAVKDLFGCSAVGPDEDVGFLYVLADAVAYAVQYTSKVPGSSGHNLLPILCDGFMLNETRGDPVDRFAGFVDLLLGRLGDTCVSFSTLAQTLNDTRTLPDMNQRQWYWQSCLQFGFFQVAPDPSKPGQPEPIRSTRIDLAYHLGLCREVFGQDMTPATAGTNRRYGGVNPVSSRIYYTSGSLDPWKALSRTDNATCCSSLVSRTINGTAHCADLYPENDADPADLTETRRAIRAQVAAWLAPQDQNVDCPDAGSGSVQSCDGQCVDTDSDVFHCGGCVPSTPVTHHNASEYFCRAGELLPVDMTVNNSVWGSRELFITGVALSVVGFIALCFGLHALRKRMAKTALVDGEPVAYRSSGPSDAHGSYAAPNGIASPSATVPSARQPLNNAEHGWSSDATQPLHANQY